MILLSSDLNSRWILLSSDLNSRSILIIKWS